MGEWLGRGHSHRILSMVEQVLNRGQLALDECDAIAFDRGPGSFTGIRIGVGVAQGLAYGKTLPLVPVSSLQALALGCDGEYAEWVAVAIDARMGQIYWACYQRTGTRRYELFGNEQVIKPDEIRLTNGQQWIGVGSGWDSYGEEIKMAAQQAEIKHVPDRYPHAREIATLGAQRFSCEGGVQPESGFPEYIRNKVTN